MCEGEVVLDHSALYDFLFLWVLQLLLPIPFLLTNLASLKSYSEL